MPPRTPLNEYPTVPIYERLIYDGKELETFAKERKGIQQLLAQAGAPGHILVEVRSKSQWEKGYDRGPGPGDSKSIVVRGLFRDEVIDEIRIGKPAFLQSRREQKAIRKMAQLVIDKRQTKN